MTEHGKNKKNRRNTSKDIPFCFVLNRMRLIKKHQPGMKVAQMMTSEEAPGLLDRTRTGGRMTTARASDGGDVTAVFLFLSGMADKENQNISDLESRRTAGDCRYFQLRR